MATSDEITDRERFFTATLERFSAEVNSLAAPDGVVARTEAIPYASRLYFLLSDAYKRKRLFRHDEHRTEPYKVAALTSATLIGACLLEPKEPDNVTSEYVALCNEYYSVYCACVILDVRHWDIRESVLQRQYKALQCMSFDVCHEYQVLIEKAPADALSLAEVALSARDFSTLDQLVNVYMGWWADY